MNRARRIVHALRHELPVVIFVCVCVVACVVPLTNVVGYEYATVLSLALSTLGLWDLLVRTNREADPWPEALRLGRRLLVWLALGTTIGVANALRVRNCDLPGGLLRVGVLAGGAIPVVVATAMAFAQTRWPRRLATVGVLVSLLSSGLFLALHPPIIAYNPYLGYFAGSIFDEALVGMQRHLVFRAWNLVWALAVVQLLVVLWRRRAGLIWHASARGVAALLALWAAGWGWRGDLGMERNRAWIAEELGGHYADERIVLHYDLRRTDPEVLRRMIVDHHARRTELELFFETTVPGPLTSWVYASPEQRGDYMGGRRTLVAKIWLGEMHITWDGLGDRMLAHEMAHLVLREDGAGPLRLASAWGVVPLMALVEGAATAADWGGSELDYHAWSAAMHTLGLAESIETILGPAAFWSRYSGRVYTLAGSFGRYLIQTRGAPRFRQAYRRGDFEGAYGESLGSLVAEWRGFLATYPVDPLLLEVARARYDRPSLFGRVCGRAIATWMQDGRDALRTRDRAAARRCFNDVVQHDPTNMRARMDIANAWAAVGDIAEATAHAASVADAAGAGVVLQQDARELLADLAWHADRFEDADAIWAALSGETGEAGRLRGLAARRMAVAQREVAPRTHAATRRWLARGNRVPTHVATAELLDAWHTERTPLSAYLAGLALADGDSPLVATLLDPSQLAALQDAQQVRALEALAMHHSIAFDPDGACPRWASLAARAAAGSAEAARAAMWLGRCERGEIRALDADGRPVE